MGKRLFVYVLSRFLHIILCLIYRKVLGFGFINYFLHLLANVQMGP